MSLKQFRKKDIFFNILETYPEHNFFINNSKIYYRKNVGLNQTPEGHVDLYEMNVNRPNEESLIYPFITKQGTRSTFSTTSEKLSSFSYGDVIKGSYPMTASLTRTYIPAGTSISHYTFDNSIQGESYTPAHPNKKYINSLENVIRNYHGLSHHYQFVYDQADGTWNKSTQAINLISIPSIFYGSSIKKKSTKLSFYINGQVKSELSDVHGNGELIETTGSNVGSVAGVILYNHGFMVLTGSWNLDATTAPYEGAGTNVNPKWLNFGLGIPAFGTDTSADSSGVATSGFSVSFRGTQKIPTITMLAHARKNEANYSSNPTAIDSRTRLSGKTSPGLLEVPETEIKKINKSNFKADNKEFAPEAYISKIGIFDEKQNLLGFVSLATPVKKNQKRDYTFKIKLDI